MVEPAPRDSRGRTRSVRKDTTRASKNAQDLTDRRIKAVALRTQGLTYDQIAEQLGVGHYTAFVDVKTMLQVREAETVPQLRQIEQDRLDGIVATAAAIVEKWQKTKPELALKALDRILRAVQIRAALLGLNAPVEVSVTQQTQLDAEITALLAQQEALNQATRAGIIEGEATDVHDTDTAALPSGGLE